MTIPKGHAKVPMSKGPATRVGMGRMPKSMGRGMHAGAIKKGSMHQTTGPKLRMQKGK
jgi:hypothetical protein